MAFGVGGYALLARVVLSIVQFQSEQMGSWTFPGTEIHRFVDLHSACAFYVCRFVDRLRKLEPSRGATESK